MKMNGGWEQVCWGGTNIRMRAIPPEEIPCLHVYVWLSPFAVHLKILQHS